MTKPDLLKLLTLSLAFATLLLLDSTAFGAKEKEELKKKDKASTEEEGNKNTKKANESNEFEGQNLAWTVRMKEEKQ